MQPRNYEAILCHLNIVPHRCNDAAFLTAAQPKHLIITAVRLLLGYMAAETVPILYLLPTNLSPPSLLSQHHRKTVTYRPLRPSLSSSHTHAHTELLRAPQTTPHAALADPRVQMHCELLDIDVPPTRVPSIDFVHLLTELHLWRHHRSKMPP